METSPWVACLSLPTQVRGFHCIFWTFVRTFVRRSELMVDIAKAILLRITARSFKTRTRDLFSAIDKQVGEKGKKVVYYVYFVPKSPYCSSISAPKLFPNSSRNMKQGKTTRSPVLRGRIQMHIWHIVRIEYTPAKSFSVEITSIFSAPSILLLPLLLL